MQVPFRSFQVHGMLSQMDPSLVTFCDKIAEEGGPISLPAEDGTTIPQPPVTQMISMTRASARLNNVQPEVNLDRSNEPTRKSKKQTDASQTGTIFTFHFKQRRLADHRGS